MGVKAQPVQKFGSGLIARQYQLRLYQGSRRDARCNRIQVGGSVTGTPIRNDVGILHIPQHDKHGASIHQHAPTEMRSVFLYVEGDCPGKKQTAKPKSVPFLSPQAPPNLTHDKALFGRDMML